MVAESGGGWLKAGGYRRLKAPGEFLPKVAQRWWLLTLRVRLRGDERVAGVAVGVTLVEDDAVFDHDERRRLGRHEEVAQARLLELAALAVGDRLEQLRREIQREVEG